MSEVHLTGMDQCLAVKTQCPPLFRFCAKTLRIAELVVDAVQHIKPAGAGRADQMNQMGDQGDPLLLGGAAQRLAQIIGPRDQSGQTRADRAGDGVEGHEGQRGLDHRPDRDRRTV